VTERSTAGADERFPTGKLTERDGHVVLNCPIIKVGKG